MLGSKDKDRWDLALAAAARVYVLVTRSIEDFETRGVRLLDPFRDPPVRIDTPRCSNDLRKKTWILP